MVDAVLTASRVLVAIAARSLADAGEEVTLTQYRSLVILASRGPQSLAALAEAVAVTPPTASRLCERLVRKGLGAAPQRPQRPPPGARRADASRPESGRCGDCPAPTGDRRSAGVRAGERPTLGRGRAAPAGRQRRRGARAGLEQRVGSLSDERLPASSNLATRVRASRRPCGPLALGDVVSQEVDRPQRGHRGRGRAWGRSSSMRPSRCALTSSSACSSATTSLRRPEKGGFGGRPRLHAPGCCR
jgi:hypothetical protein